MQLSAPGPLGDERAGVLSTQVLQEPYVNATRKIRTPLPKAAARSIVTTYAAWCVDSLTPRDVASAFQIEEAAAIGFWGRAHCRGRRAFRSPAAVV